MHNHFQQGNGGNAYILKIVRVPLPRLIVPNDLLLSILIGVEGITVDIDELDSVLKLCYR